MAKESITTEIDLSDDDKDRKKVVAREEDDRSSSQEDDDIEFEVQDDTPEQDRGRPAPAPNAKSAVPSDEEIGEYTKGVQDRIKQIKWEYHNERRAKEQWQRQSDAAVEYAKKVHKDNEKLREMLTKGHKTLVDSTKASAESELTTLQQSLATALETGATAQAAELQAKIARAAARAEAQNHVAPISFPESEEQPQQRQTEQRPQVKLSQTMQSWMDENPWFNENKRMTAFAFGVHEELIAKGIPVESPRYFQEINKSVRDTFSNYFEADEQDNDGKTDRRSEAPQRRRTPVAGVQRNKAGGSNKVTLTSSELAVAKRMGITPVAYAREKARLEQLDG
jgi:hypothetical protein